MTTITIKSDNDWAKQKITSAIQIEVQLLQRAIANVKMKLQQFESQYGELNRERLYGKVDDMVLLEWEGEIEVLERLEKKLASLEGITFEYK